MRRRFELVLLLSVCATPASPCSSACAMSGERSVLDEGVTETTFNRAIIEAERGEMVGAMRANAPPGAPWIEDAAALLGDMSAWYVDWGDFPSDEELARRSRELIEHGCTDPGVIYYHALVTDGGADRESSLELFRDAEKAIEHAGYPTHHLAVIRSRLGAAYVNAGRADDAASAFARAVDAWVRSAAEQSAAKVPPRRILYQMSRWVTKVLPRPVSRRVVDGLLADAGVDRWLALTLEGYCQTQEAWNARGLGAANTVNREGRKGFSEHIMKATEAFDSAFALAPDRPEPAAWQVSVRNAISPQDKETLREWFDRSTKAQIDWAAAYEYYLFALRPRWGGTHAKMIEFGEHCRDTARFDTAVPTYYVRALLDVCEETGGYSRTWRDDAMYASAKEILTRCAEQAPSRARARSYLSLLAALSRWAGWPQDGYAALERIGFDYDHEEFRRAGLAAPAAVRDILCYGSGAGETYAAAVRAERDGDVRKAAELCQQALEEHKDAPEPVRRAMESRAISSRMVADYEGGDSVDLGAAGLIAWNLSDGKWNFNTEGGVIRALTPGYNAIGSWAEFGHDFEAEVDITFPAEAQSNYCAGMIFNFQWLAPNARFQQVLLYPGRSVGRIGSGVFAKNAAEFPVRLKTDAPNRLTLVLLEQAARVLVNGVEVYSGPVPPPSDSWRPGAAVGLWVTGFDEPTGFSGFHIRKHSPGGQAESK